FSWLVRVLLDLGCCNGSKFGSYCDVAFGRLFWK
ncbi:hypothetical protein Tco_1545424, partial [Tanacetum coccineum]